MKTYLVPEDERTIAVANASYRLAYFFVCYGLLLSAAYRGYMLQQQSWDLLALVIISGALTTAYQGARHTLSWRWSVVAGLAMVAAAALAAALVLLR